ncbi:hypothetical protein ABFS82_02G057300 [Erythranthe guttata]
MKSFQILVILFSALLTGCAASSPYDYSATTDCLGGPWSPLYDGGLIGNPNFDSGLDEWDKFGLGKVELRTSKYVNNNYMVAYDRKMATDSFSHIFYVQKDLYYTFSAWFQIDEGSEIISAFVQEPNGTNVIVGSVIAKSGCWSMLKGGFEVDQNMKVQLFFASKNTDIEIWIDNASLKPFTKAEWRAQQNKSINKVRKRNVRIHVTSEDGLKLRGAKVIINQTRSEFIVGSGTTSYIVDNKGYQDWFVSRFAAATFNNEMKWYYTEVGPDMENYTVTDAMVSFFRQNGIAVRGHAVHWDATNVNQYWVKLLAPRDIFRAAMRRVGSIVSRYSGSVNGWDVMNENMHNSFFEEKLGANASAMFYQIVRAMDPQTPLFLNEYNVLEYPMDLKVIPWKYVEKIREIRAFTGNENMPLSIGIQGHFLLKPNVSHIRASFDILGATGMPIWLTELDFRRGPNQVFEFEDVMREAFAHPAVEGIIVWAGWKPTSCNERCLSDKNYTVLPTGCMELCLVDSNFNNTPAGDVYDKLMKEWKTTNVTGYTDKEGIFEEKVFLGEYSLTYSHPLIPRPVITKFNVTRAKEPLDVWVSL